MTFGGGRRAAASAGDAAAADPDAFTYTWDVTDSDGGSFTCTWDVNGDGVDDTPTWGRAMARVRVFTGSRLAEGGVHSARPAREIRRLVRCRSPAAWSVLPRFDRRD